MAEPPPDNPGRRNFTISDFALYLLSVRDLEENVMGGISARFPLIYFNGLDGASKASEVSLSGAGFHSLGPILSVGVYNVLANLYVEFV